MRKVNRITATGIAQITQAKREASLKRLYQREDYQRMLKEVKYNVSMGLTLDEIKAKMNIKQHFWDTIMCMMADLPSNPKVIYFHNHLKLQTRYQQAASLMVRSQENKDRKTEAQMIMLMAKLDESQIQLAETLGIIKPGDLITPNTREVYETMTDEQLESELARLSQSASREGYEAKPILDAESIELQQNSEPNGNPNQLGQSPVDADDTRG